MNNRKLKELYYDNKSGFQTLGCLIKKPDLLKDKRYPLTTKDFQEPFHKYLYGAIFNLSMQGVEQITPIEIEAYLSNVSPKHYKVVFEDNNGFEWLNMVEEHTTLANFDYNYDRVKKFTLLRECIEEGVDISDILDQTEVDTNAIEKQNIEFNSMTVEDIIKHCDGKMIRVKSKFNLDIESSYRKAGDNSLIIKERLKAAPSYGLLFSSGYYNTVSMGMRRTKFAIRSGASGSGKSRSALAELCEAIAVEKWDYKLQKFIKNPNNPDGELSGAYIGTELELEEEVEVIAWAIISGVPTERIIENSYLEGEEERVEYAIDILGRSQIHLYDEPNISIGRINAIAEYHSNNDKNFFGLFFDYISITGDIMKEFTETRKGMAIREDQVYLFISNECKKTAKRYNIYFGSSTQLNVKSSEGEHEKNAGMIRGSFALIDKADMGVIIMPPSQKELDKVDSIIKSLSNGFGKKITPNRVEHIFKSRGTKYKEVRIWQHVDLGTMEITDLFVTDYDYKRLNINPTIAKLIE
jgi:replicative DNA helicase